MNLANIVFYFLATVILVAALLAVTVKNLYHCSLFLVLSLFGVAGVFIYLGTEFLAAVQVLIYVGAVTILIIFGIMLTRHVMDGKIPIMNKQKWSSVIVALLFTWIVCEVICYSTVRSTVVMELVAQVDSIPDVHILGQYLLRPEHGFVFAFELISFLLLSALVGSIVIARKENE